MTDDEGVLGNLPRSRPGKRSAKRDSGVKAAAKPAAKPSTKPRRAATPKPGRRAAGATGPAQPADRAPQQSGDAVAGAVQAAATVAVTGVRVAGAVTREIVRRMRLP